MCLFIDIKLKQCQLSAFLQLSQRKCTSQKSHLEGRSMFIYKYKGKLLQLSAFLQL